MGLKRLYLFASNISALESCTIRLVYSLAFSVIWLIYFFNNVSLHVDLILVYRQYNLFFILIKFLITTVYLCLLHFNTHFRNVLQSLQWNAVKEICVSVSLKKLFLHGPNWYERSNNGRKELWIQGHEKLDLSWNEIIHKNIVDYCCCSYINSNV